MFHVRIGPYELSSNVVLAPMAGVTDRPFRAAGAQIWRGTCRVGNDHQRCAALEYEKDSLAHESRR